MPETIIFESRNSIPAVKVVRLFSFSRLSFSIAVPSTTSKNVFTNNSEKCNYYYKLNCFVFLGKAILPICQQLAVKFANYFVPFSSLCNTHQNTHHVIARRAQGLSEHSNEAISLDR
jgi:hypothetical protein